MFKHFCVNSFVYMSHLELWWPNSIFITFWFNIPFDAVFYAALNSRVKISEFAIKLEQFTVKTSSHSKFWLFGTCLTLDNGLLYLILYFTSYARGAVTFTRIIHDSPLFPYITSTACSGRAGCVIRGGTMFLVSDVIMLAGHWLTSHSDWAVGLLGYRQDSSHTSNHDL